MSVIDISFFFFVVVVVAVTIGNVKCRKYLYNWR